jgi:hypothetical protein
VVVEHFGPHKRHPITPTLKKFPDVDFIQGKFDYNDSTRTYTQAGYAVTASSQSSGSEVWRLFDDGEWDQEAIDKYPATTFVYNPSSNPSALGGVSGEWFKVEFPRKVVIDKFILNVGDTVNPGPKAFKVLGSDDDTNWTEVKDVTGLTPASYSTSAPYKTIVKSVSSVAYKYYAVVITQLLAVARVSIREVEFYGYEEDPPAGDTSIDTTFTSILNTPQTGGVKVYVDGDTLDNKVTGPTPTSTGATYDSTGKYWSITSNISVEANTFMSGDQPHTVSVWFNSSNLEANVSNTCVFSVSDQEHLNSENLKLQSNTWHNLTYAYQGEGGSKVTYLDGRKVSEDQAEDTFGEYPPFAMTGYSQGGYVVSASNEDVADTYFAWKVFDDGTGSIPQVGWFSDQLGNYNGTNGAVTTTSTVRLAPETEKGEWLQLEFPYFFHLDYFTIFSQSDSQTVHTVDNLIVYAKKRPSDTWTSLGTFTGIAARQSASGVSEAVNADEMYKYFAIVVTKRYAQHATDGVTIRELKYYGHRENDLVHLPDPTRVLKYPHIAMTGPAQRGYVVTASDTHNTVISNNGGPWQAFDGTITQVTTEGWVTPNSRYSNDAAGSTAVNGVANSFNGRDGEWLNIKLPHKITLSSFETFVRIDRDHEHPTSGYLYASNDGFATFQEIYSFTDVAVPGEVNGKVTHVIPSSHLSVNLIPYNEYRIQVTKLEGASGLGSIAELQLYGTGVDSIPIQIGGGNIDKVANFRVYDKFVEENQALEIWDAQKDEFGRVKSSVTLHKGRLGIGTTEPEGRLAVLDEPHNLEEFPPRAMTGYKNYFEGHGVFEVENSSVANSNYRSFDAFDKDEDPLVSTAGWVSGLNTYDTSGTGLASGGSATDYFSTYGAGSWLKLKLPYAIKLKSSKFSIRAPSNTLEPLKSFTIYGSRDNTNWDALYSQSTSTPQSFSIDINSTEYYKCFVIHITEVDHNQGYAGIVEWRLFGTREQGQSVLHDGQLTLTKNLNVPRIGPALDADDTPRRDRLVVEYNTSTNPTFEGAVRDTSGRGNDGIFVGTASYNASEKALVFDGNSDYVVSGDLGIPSGAFVHSVSLWCKRDSEGSNMYLSSIGGENDATLTSRFSMMLLANAGTIHLSISGSNSTFTGDITSGSWFHIVYTYNGGAQGSSSTAHTVYVNGIEKPIDGGTNAMTLNLPENSRVALGSQPWGGSNYFDGSISNFKLYDKILTASEVKTLYDMGRTGRVVPKILQIDTPVQINAPLYAPGTILNVSQFVHTEDYAITNSVNFLTTFTTPEISMKAGSKVHLHVHIPWRHDNGGAWSGGYHLIYFRLNKTVSDITGNTWIMLSNSGYHMISNASAILDYTNSYYLPLSVDEDFTIQFEHRYKSYNQTAAAFRINQSHHLNAYVDANLLKLGFQANNMGYLKFIVTEISK